MTNIHAWPAVYQGELLPDPDPDLADSPVGIEELRRGLSPDREVHDWDGQTRTVTSYVRCAIGDHHVWGAGVGGDRAEATRRALLAVRARVQSPASTSAS
jgi:hypothetical protein